MMKVHVWIIVLIVAAAVTFWGVGKIAEAWFGFERVLEHGPDWTIDQLNALKKPPADPNATSSASRYAFPILFPFDLLEMILIAGACSIASVVWGRYLGVPQGWLWLLLLLPCVYLAFDLAEDTLLAFLLTAQEQLADGLISVARMLTTAKLFVVKGAIGQTGIIALLALATLLYRKIFT